LDSPFFTFKSPPLIFFLFLSSSRDSLGWAVLLNFLVYITIPVVLQYTGLLLGIGSFAIYVNTIIGLAKKENFFLEQVNFFYSRKPIKNE
jgi:adenylate cyclase 3